MHTADEREESFRPERSGDAVLVAIDNNEVIGFTAYGPFGTSTDHTDRRGRCRSGSSVPFFPTSRRSLAGASDGQEVLLENTHAARGACL